MSNANNIVEIAITDNHSDNEDVEVVKLPRLPKVAASNIGMCHSLLRTFPFNRGIFEDLSCYIVNPEYLAWTIKLRLPLDGEVIENDKCSGFIPPTQLVYADVLRNYMEKIVPLNFAVGDITIELRFVSGQEMRLWCVDFVMEPVFRNDLPSPPVLPEVLFKQYQKSKQRNASKPKPSNPVQKVCTPSPYDVGKSAVPLALLYPPQFLVGNNINHLVQSAVSVSKKRKRKN